MSDQWWSDFFDILIQHQDNNNDLNGMLSRKLDLPDPNDPEDFARFYEDPLLYLFGKGVLDWWKDKNINADLDRWYDDWFKNTGESWKNSPYPWYQYYSREGRNTGSGSSGALLEEFGVNDAIMRLYRKRW